MVASRAGGSSRAARDSKGVLYVVATPIGNLEDITLRALKVLKQVQLVAAEDTRRTGILLRHFDIDTPILSVHEHNERARISEIIGRLSKGESVAIVTDAGTPAISDPGTTLVAAVREAGLSVEPIPGANAIVAAISASGISTEGFVFLGFPPFRLKDRNKWMAEAVESSKRRLVAFFEAPHRLRRTLEDLAVSVDRPILLARELTKIHEEFVTGKPADLLAKFASPQGEFTVMIPPIDSTHEPTTDVSEGEVVRLFGQITESRPSETKRAVARETGERLGLSARQVYDIMERHKSVE